MKNNEIELQLIEDNFDGVDNLIPKKMEDLLKSADYFCCSDVMAHSTSILALFCVFKRTVEAFAMPKHDYAVLGADYDRLIGLTIEAIEKEHGSEHRYVGFLDILRWR